MIADCASNALTTEWAPGLFQFQIQALMLLLFYLATMAACGRRLYLEAGSVHPERATLALWGSVAILLAILFANRLFNLQALATIAVRCAALAEGIYEGRRPLQVAAIAVAVVCAGLAFAILSLRRRTADERLALAGIVALAAFVAARSVSLHGIDGYLGLKVLGFSFNGLAEGAALTLILAGALRGSPRY